MNGVAILREMEKVKEEFSLCNQINHSVLDMLNLDVLQMSYAMCQIGSWQSILAFNYIFALNEFCALLRRWDEVHFDL